MWELLSHLRPPWLGNLSWQQNRLDRLEMSTKMCNFLVLLLSVDFTEQKWNYHDHCQRCWKHDSSLKSCFKMNPPILAQKLTSDCGKIFRNTELPPWREITPQLVSRTTNHHHKYINSQKNCHHHDHHHRYDHHHHHHHHHHHQQNHCQNLLICGPSLPNAICITIV